METGDMLNQNNMTPEVGLRPLKSHMEQQEAIAIYLEFRKQIELQQTFYVQISSIPPMVHPDPSAKRAVVSASPPPSPFDIVPSGRCVIIDSWPSSQWSTAPAPFSALTSLSSRQSAHESSGLAKNCSRKSGSPDICRSKPEKGT